MEAHLTSRYGSLARLPVNPAASVSVPAAAVALLQLGWD